MSWAWILQQLRRLFEYPSFIWLCRKFFVLGTSTIWVKVYFKEDQPLYQGYLILFRPMRFVLFSFIQWTWSVNWFFAAPKTDQDKAQQNTERILMVRSTSHVAVEQILPSAARPGHSVTHAFVMSSPWRRKIAAPSEQGSTWRDADDVIRRTTQPGRASLDEHLGRYHGLEPCHDLGLRPTRGCALTRGIPTVTQHLGSTASSSL